GEHERGLKMGCAVGGLRELLTELAEGRMRGAAADEAEGGDVPEHRGSAVSEHHLVAFGQVEQIGQAGADAADEVLHRSLAVAGAEHRRRGLVECLDLGGADAGRAGPSVRRRAGVRLGSLSSSQSLSTFYGGWAGAGHRPVIWGPGTAVRWGSGSRSSRLAEYSDACDDSCPGRDVECEHD